MNRPALLASPGAVVATGSFTALAVLRAVQGDVLWAAVFGLAAGGYAWLAATRPHRAGTGRPGPSVRRATTHADTARRCRTWRLLTTTSAALSTALALWSEPALALLAVATTAVAGVGWLTARRALHSRNPLDEGARP